MRDVNAAWAVLRDPERRAAYDRELARQQRPPETASAPRPRVDHGDHADLVAVAPAGPLTAVLGGLPWLVVLGLLAAIFVFTAYAAGGRDDAPADGGPPASVAISDLRGQCVQRTNGLTLVVNCGVTPNEGRIVALAGGGAECPAGTTAIAVPQQGVDACVVPTG